MAKAISQTNYSFLEDSYTGGGGFDDGSYLIQYIREDTDKFTRRMEASWYPNFVKKVWSSYLSHLFKRGPVRLADGNDLFVTFIDDCDRRGTHLDAYMRQAARLAGLLGTVWLILDSPADIGANKAEQREKRGFPYLVLRTPADLEDWTVDDVGALVRIVFREPGEKDQYRIYEPEGWKIAESPDGTKVISSGSYDLGGLLPIIPLHSTEPLKPTDITAAPWVWPIAVANWELFNKVSELDEILRAQTFSVLTLPVVEDADIKRYEKMTLSTETGLVYNAEGGGKPEYLAPPDGPARVYMDWIGALIEKIYKLSGLEFTGGAKATAGASGVALSFQFQEANNNLGSLAELCEKAERLMAKLFGLWTKREVKDLSISYPRDFNVVDLEAEVKRGLDALTMGISETFDQELKKSLARRLLGQGVADETLARIDKEIEAGDVYETQAEDELKQQEKQKDEVTA